MISRRELIAGSASMLLLPAKAQTVEQWPDIDIKPEWVKELNERFAGPSGIFHDGSYPEYLQDYKSDGDYLNWGVIRSFRNDNEIVITENGLPMVKDSPHGQPYWNAVTLSHYALICHGRNDRPEFFKAIDKLIELQRADGGFPYPPRVYRKLQLADGWVSGMAQGNAMSAFYRATLLNSDPRYRQAGELAFASLLTPTSKGGPATSLADLHPSLSAYPFLAEYPTDPIDYTLNGYMFTLLGLYDWSKISPKADAEFKRNIETLERLLPYHDIDGFSTYDLSHIVLKLDPYVHEHYEGIHVYLLHALASVTNSPTFKQYELKWAKKIDEMNRPLRITRISSDAESPRPAGTSIKFELQSEGGKGGAKLYQFAIWRGGTWTVAQPFSPDNSFAWKPAEPGDYMIRFYAKEAGTEAEFDNFRQQRFTIKASPKDDRPWWNRWFGGGLRTMTGR
jgi:hypothetical protein